MPLSYVGRGDPGRMVTSLIRRIERVERQLSGRALAQVPTGLGAIRAETGIIATITGDEQSDDPYATLLVPGGGLRMVLIAIYGTATFETTLTSHAAGIDVGQSMSSLLQTATEFSSDTGVHSMPGVLGAFELAGGTDLLVNVISSDLDHANVDSIVGQVTILSFPSGGIVT